VTNNPVYFLALSTSRLITFSQLQTNRFLLKFTGNEEEINLLGDGTEKPEFGEWSWMSPEQIIDRVDVTVLLFLICSNQLNSVF
jgi:hypothetical protein